MPTPTLPPQAYTREMLSQAYAWLQTQNEPVRKLATNSDALVALYLRYQRYGDLGIGRAAGANGSVGGESAVASNTHGNGYATPDIEHNGTMGSVQHEQMNFGSSPSSLAFRSEIRTMAEDIGDHQAIHDSQSSKVTPIGRISNDLANANANIHANNANAIHSAPSHLNANHMHAQSHQQHQAFNASSNHAHGATIQQGPPNSISINLLNVQQSQMTANINGAQSSSLASALDSVSMSIVQNVQASLNLSSDVEACRVLIKMGFDKLKPLMEGR